MSRSVLLVMDFQKGIVERHGGAEAARQAARAVEAARGAGIPVIWVRVAFRQGYPDVSPANRAFSAIAAAGQFLDGAEAAAFDPTVAPTADDLVVTKKRFSAFAGSDLDVLLRSAGADTVVLAGIATSGVVLSTVRQAGDLDYGLIVLADACADADEEVHRVLLEKVFPRQAEISTVDGWIKSL